MSNPEMPPQTPTTPVAPDAAPAPLEPSEPPSEAASNGTTGEAEVPSAESAGQDDTTPTEQSRPESGAPPGPSGEKKRRRRRRKKKPGAQGSPEGAAAEAHETGADEPNHGGEMTAGESATAEPGTVEPGTAEPGGESPRQDRRDRRRDKKHGPTRERPPVNAGDIVFGKILEITEDAIFVDIPGKARAIFDRHEMLLPEEEDHRRSAAPPVPAAPSESSESAPATLPEGTAEGAAAAASSPEGEGLPDASEAVAEAAAEPASEPEQAAPPAEAIALPAAEETSAPAAEPLKEPKVPRVILEVGADFIGVVHNDGARGGLVVLTHHPNRAEKVKPVLEKALHDKTTALGLVTGVIKGGIEVDVDGLRAFAPGSHVDLRMGADLSYLVGSRLPFFVTQYAKRGRDVVLSRKSIIEEEGRRSRVEALARLKVGEELDGIVRSVVPFGAFIDVGGVEGLVPLQEMSHNRGDGPSDIFKAGEPTRVKVIKIDDRGKVWLSRKATIPDPWQQVAQKYAQGTRHAGKIVRLQPFGAFVELEPGVDGLIHTADLSIKRIEVPGDVVKVGDPIDVVVAHLDPMQHKIGLHPAPQGDLANEAPQRVAPHKALKVKVVAIESGGLVVRILGVTGRSARGYITSAGTGTPRGTELRKVFSVGQEIEAKVVEVDPRRGEVKLSIKALSEDQERSAYQQYRQQLKAEARFTLADLLTKKSPR